MDFCKGKGTRGAIRGVQHLVLLITFSLQVRTCQHVKLCEKWVSEQNEDRLRDLEVARNRRKDL